ncbi:anthranilate phosphoribosyltransferase [Ramicandelaber brevisporus]|nr:anthranilate phosphoribosyltransferase [Ramicandelaber brevisporus]
MTEHIQKILGRLIATPEAFTAEDAHAALTQIMRREATEAQAAGFLVALKLQGMDTRADVVAACAAAMRGQALMVKFDDANSSWLSSASVVDIVGTGGDGHNTFNVSTASALVAAGAGCFVAKHGNRAASSNSGSADFLEKLGADLEQITPDTVANCLAYPRRINQDGAEGEGAFCFLFAQSFHPSMRHIAPLRKQLGIRTVFNLLGPMVNPTMPGRAIVGVASPAIGPMMAEALRLGGVRHGLVVCGAEGLDEISPAGITHVWTINDDESDISKKVLYSTIHPLEDFGIPVHPLTDVKGESASANAEIMNTILTTSESDLEERLVPIRDYIVLNTAALLVAAGKAQDFRQGAQMARDSIYSGRALRRLQDFVNFTKSQPAFTSSH